MRQVVWRPSRDTYIGFDSAWADNPKKPGAICAVELADCEATRFHCPRLVSFTSALTFIRGVRSGDGITLVALDQPTVVPNLTGSRPVETVARSLIGWLGGAVQPASRGRVGMFSDSAPIWRFIDALGAAEDPERARTATDGLHLMEVFPALALASLDDSFFGRLSGPHYNPDRRKTFRRNDWAQVALTAAECADGFGCGELAEWCRAAGKIERPKKHDQDMMDAAICVLVALNWRLRPRDASMLLGDLVSGYMVLPSSVAVRQYLTERANRLSVPVDGVSLS